MAYVSNELFHLVGRKEPFNHQKNAQILEKILQDGSISHPPHKKGWGNEGYTCDLNKSLLTEELIVPFVTCFCDIPFEELKIHYKKYGIFGLSLGRQLLIEYGARPVVYIPIFAEDWKGLRGRILLKDMENIYRSFQELVVDRNQKSSEKPRAVGKPLSTPEEAISAMDSIFLKEFLAFVKPFNSELSIDNPENYYLEREWRKYGNMQFTPQQVIKVLVAQDYEEYFRKNYPEYSEQIVGIPVLE